MALTELSALDDAYRALESLGQAARRRALQWLADALVHGHTIAQAPAVPEATEPTVEPVLETVVEPLAVTVAPQRRKAAAAATAKQVPAVMSKSRRGRRVKGGTSQATVNVERPYRRMPDPETIMKAYRKVGTVSALADRFEVPRHTVNHWARRLRDQGYDIGRAH